MNTVTFTYLALGDSYTVGEGIDAGKGFPFQLRERIHLMNGPKTTGQIAAFPGEVRADNALLTKAAPIAASESPTEVNQGVDQRPATTIDLAEPVIVAKTGWTTAELIEGIENAGLENGFDLVTLLIGVNNQYRGLSLEEYRKEFTNLVETAITLAGKNYQAVFVLSIPDWSATPFAAALDRPLISKAIDQFNAINRQISDQYDINYIEITAGTRAASENAGLVAGDKLHPSEREYGNWVNKLAPAVYRELSQMAAHKPGGNYNNAK